MTDDTVDRLRLAAQTEAWASVWGLTVVRCSLLRDAADEIERFRAENAALYEANHQAMWDDTLIPIANAFGVDLNDEYGVPRRQFQMVDAIIKEARRD